MPSRPERRRPKVPQVTVEAPGRRFTVRRRPAAHPAAHPGNSLATASSSDAVKDPNYKPRYVPGTSGLPSLDNIPSVADLTASFAARKEERIKQEQEKKEAERRVSAPKASLGPVDHI